MSRAQLLYQIYYSYRLHAMFSVICGRIDRTLSFLLLLLGSSVMGNLRYPFLLGLLIAGITAIKMAFPFETTSEAARKQAAQYLNLYTSCGLTASIDELTSHVSSAQKNDMTVWHSLVNPTELHTQIALGEVTSSIKLSRGEKIMAFLAGELPKQ